MGKDELFRQAGEVMLEQEKNERAAWRRKVLLGMRQALTFAAAIAVPIALIALYSHGVKAEPASKAVFVVVTEKLDGTPYARAVALVVPVKGGHVGVVLNKPTQRTMGELFPEHPPSAKVERPVYDGGPVMTDTMFMLARFPKRPADKAFEMLPGIWLVFDAAVIDQVIETRPNEGRYYVGSTQWPEGALAERVKAGVLVVKPAKGSQVFGDTEHLYEQLMPAGPRV